MNQIFFSHIKETGVKVRSFLEHTPKGLWSCNLDGACAIASFISWKLLTNNNINCSMIVGQWDCMGHCWLEIPHKRKMYVLDVTATQFISRIEPVVFLPKPKYNKLEFMSGIESQYRIKDEADMIWALDEWPDEQKPCYLTKEIQEQFGIQANHQSCT